MKNYHNNKFVIINADDFGITKGVNKAISELVDAGTVSSTTVMSNMPDYKDIVDIKNKIGVGIHFNLTVGYPVTKSSRALTLINKEGDFLELPKLLEKMKQGKLLKLEVETELESQIQRLISIEVHPDHIDSHESLLKYPFFMRIMKRLAKKYNIMAIRTYSPRKFDYYRLLNPRSSLISLYLAVQKFGWKRQGFHVLDKYDSLIKFGLDYEMAIEKLREIFQDLPSGVLEIGVHPGYCNGDEAVLGGYIQERESELKALASDDMKKFIADSNAQLITFQDAAINTGQKYF